MKRSILLITSFLAVASFTLTGYMAGPSTGASGGNKTGGPGSGGATCAQIGCHGGGVPSANLVISHQLLDFVTEAPIASQKYTPGGLYKIAVSCIYTGSGLSDPNFGYQIMTLKSAVPNDNAGTMSGLASQPGNSNLVNVGGKSILEHTIPADPATPNGVTIKYGWTAPNPGVGNVNIYGCFNAVNKNNLADAPDEVSNKPLGLIGTIVQQSAGVEELSQDIRITAFPNPVQDQLNLGFDGAEGVYTIDVFDINGRILRRQELNIRNQKANTSIATSNWAAGTYLVRVMKDGAQRVITVSK